MWAIWVFLGMLYLAVGYVYLKSLARSTGEMVYTPILSLLCWPLIVFAYALGEIEDRLGESINGRKYNE